jgi:hypothetical protein
METDDGGGNGTQVPTFEAARRKAEREVGILAALIERMQPGILELHPGLLIRVLGQVADAVSDLMDAALPYGESAEEEEGSD